MRRREFVGSAAAAMALPWLGKLPRSTGGPVALPIRPLPLADVRLRPGPFLDSLEVNRRFLFGQDPDRLLHTFRLTAGLPTSTEPIGGWEAPDNELRGHFTGHYLSASALLYASTGDRDAKARGEVIVEGMARCQEALGNGYLSAFPDELFERLRADRSVWAPWYTVHKIMAGLLDQYTLAGNAQALDVLKRMARWAARYLQPLGDAQMARMLEREYGGMNELLYNLAAVTGNDEWSALAHRFDHERIFGPLALGRDELKGLHVNTTVPKIIGAARRYELTGDERYRRIAEYFWHEVISQRAYATGGTSNEESWNAEPGILSTELGAYTQECCVTYNLLKLTRHIFSWTGDPRAADYYERALFNGVLGTQHPGDGSKLYYVPLASGYWKLFGAPGADYWCCTGSGSESHAKFGDSIYSQDERGLYLNLFIASEALWREKNVTVVQETRFPEEQGTTITVRAPRPTRFALRVRVPGWVDGGAARLNGKPLDAFAAPGGYLVLDRPWRDGDRLEVSLPMRLHAEPTPDDPSLVAPMYGPLVLAARMGTEELTPETLRAEPTKPRMVPEYKLKGLPTPTATASGGIESWIQRAGSTPLSFVTTGRGEETALVPLYRVMDERYSVYWRVG
jgi:DUF1680 family protein